MADRILIELSGEDPKFRVSRPGKSVFSTNIGDFLIREDVPCYRGAVHGEATFTGSGVITRTIPGLSGPCFVVLRSSDYLMAGMHSASPDGYYYATLLNDTTLQLRNHIGNRTVYYSVFGNPILGDP